MSKDASREVPACDRNAANTETSHERTRERFNTSESAGGYPSELGTGLRARREWQSLEACFANVPVGSKVLDLPCGTGRFVPLLLQRGYQVTAADYSPHMVEGARRYLLDKLGTESSLRFEVRDVLQTGFDDGEFDAVQCHRLFHHFNEPEIRIAALNELRRISRGPVIVSFFNSFALDAVRFRLKHLWRGTVPVDRVPIPLATFQDEAQQAGLQIGRQHPVLWGLSPLWCLVLEHQPASQTAAVSAA